MHQKNNRHEWILDWNIVTFMESKYENSITNLWNYDVAFIWIPLDHGVSYRRGAYFGPSLIREYSYREKVNGGDFFDSETESFITSNTLSIADYWNIFVVPTNTKQTEENISQTIRKIREKTFPLIVGWDHSIAYSTIKGCHDALPTNLKNNFAVLHIDAHLDTEETYDWVPEVYHWNPFRKLIEDGIIEGKNLYSIGIRWMIPKYLIDFTIRNQINLYTIHKIRKMWFDLFLKELIDLLSKYSAIYITFDIDSLDPREVVGTGTPVENGLFSFEVQKLFRNLYNLPIIGLELVEVAPGYDSSSFTWIVWVNCLWHFLAFWFNKKKFISN